jgi:hypothetical protein
MSPHEVAGLNYLAKTQGHKLTINPATGLPEAFSLGGFFSSFLPMLAGMAFAPETGGFSMAPLLAGAATGAGLAAVKGDDPLMGGLMGGLGGYGGGQLGPALGAAAPGGYVAGQAVQGAANPLMNTAVNTSLSGVGNSMMTNPLITNAANSINAAGLGAGSGIGFIDKGTQNVMNAASGLKNIATGADSSGAWNAFKAAGGTPTQLALPVGGAVLSGLEPTDIYGEPMKPNGKDKYDPYATLNLSGSTGLKLYAAGGNVNTNTSSISTGGLQDLYGTSDNSGGLQPLSQDGFGIGRLESLTSAGSQAKAADMFYAQGGPVSFADGGDTEGVKLEQLSAPTDAAPSPGGIAALANSAQMNPQGGQAPSDVNLAAPPTATDGSIITQVANNLKVDPNYQGKNPIEAAIVKQLKGTDPMQQGQPSQQGLGAIAPSQPMAPSFNPSVAMGPTYFAGMNAPGSHMAKGGYLDGQGDGMSDSIPATIEGKQPARLADGEFVVPADVVSHIGNGSSKAGSNRLYAMLDKVRKARTGHTKQGKEINPNKYMPA